MEYLDPTCGSDLRKSSEVTAIVDFMLTGVATFCGIIMLNYEFGSVKHPEDKVYSVGEIIIYVVLMCMELYLDFSLYTSAHERNIEKLLFWRKACLGVSGVSIVSIVAIHHTISFDDNAHTSPYPLLWLYVTFFLSIIFRAYMFWVAQKFIKSFELL